MGILRSVFISIFLCVTIAIHAIDYTYLSDISTFDKEDYGAGRQNWDIDVDDDNVIYIANTNGLLRYIYGQWTLNELPSGKSLRAISFYRNTIWCGGDEIGFFNVDDKGNLTYEYLADVYGYVWNIETNGDNVFFQSSNIITVYNIRTKSLAQFTFPNGLSGLGKWQNKVWTISNDRGLGTLDFDGFNLVKPFPKGQDQEVRVLFEHNDQLYIVLFNGEVLAFDGHDFNMIRIPEQLTCFSAINYDDSNFYIGSVLKGIIPVKREGDQVYIQRKIQQEQGLLDNTVLSLAVDRDGNLWAGLDYGIAKVNKESLLKSIINRGAAYDIIIHNGTTYIATNKGLYANFNSADFLLVEGTEGQVWGLKETDAGLFACHNKGLILINNATSQIVYDKVGVMDVDQVGASNQYIFSAYTGTIWVEKIGQSFIEKRNLGLWGNPKIDYDEISNSVWARGGSADTIIHRILLDDEECIVSEISMRDVFATTQGLFFYDGNVFFEFIDGDFKKSRLTLVQGIQGAGITALEVSSENNIAIYIQNDELKMIEELADGSTVVHGKLLSELNNDILEQFECIKIHDKLLYVATERGVKVLPLNRRYNHQALKDPIISQIEITYNNSHTPQTLYYPYTNKALKLASRQFKTITLSFADKKKKEIEYRYRLLPYNEEWSDWSFSQKQIAYGDLKPRDYTFELECRYNGTIERKTTVPIIIEGIEYYYLRIGILFFILIAISLIVVQYGKNQKLRLKNKYDKKRSAEEQVQAKKEQLLQFTEVIRHKNAFLVEVRGALAQMKNSAASRWVNKIDHEINQEKKDFLFHKLFSEDHQDFTQRISSQFETLTPHDLRLISFIRINANTSEIAQFLNISTSSVDTARYRLRKKLNLEHSQNLNKFIREYQ
ncbi:hypothetical protein [Carboxylicivirga sp. M1479]|uniref:hypothetical protein n=1 Tax=Carboxylicivirga sp. M1479 TaxID=2594476 RepID=UPI001177D830|nr:hypothetical protein [Carboxylicivirga sp. M1479]TRX65706.1 hypothetical protein FNN09_17390 [Carboxylicivirga sp. M1479]